MQEKRTRTMAGVVGVVQKREVKADGNSGDRREPW